MENNEYLEKIRYNIESFEFSMGGYSTKILWWWRIGGLIGLSLLLVIGYIFCTTTSHLIILGFVGLLLLCGWMIGNYYIKKNVMWNSRFALEYRELVDLKIYIADMFLTDAIEAKARGAYSRDRLSEIRALYGLLKTSEGIEKVNSILKALDFNLNDIQKRKEEE